MQLDIEEKQDWLIDKLKKRSGIKMLNDAYKSTRSDNNDIKTEIQNSLNINDVKKVKEKQIRESITKLGKEKLDSFFAKIHKEITHN